MGETLGSVNKVLMIDDDVNLCELLKEYFCQSGYDLEYVTEARFVNERIADEAPNSIILDLMLPDANGIDVLKRIREKYSIPVIMVSARGEEVDRIVGLESGADDYLSKPFSTRELVARVRALIRRSEATVAKLDSHLLCHEDLVLNLDLLTAEIDGQNLKLTQMEFRLLRILIENLGEPVDKDLLFENVLQREASPFDRTMDTHISNLRKKVGQRADGLPRIRTLRNVGYIYCR